MIIYKYELFGGPGNTIVVGMPHPGKPIKAGIQENRPVVWFLLDDTIHEPSQFTLCPVFTGCHIPTEFEEDD